MGRVPKPRPWTVGEAIKRMGITFDGPRGYRALHRIYDRTSGNFKASGWMVRVLKGDGSSVELALPDEAFPQYYQGRL